MALFGGRKSKDADRFGPEDNIVLLSTMHLYNYGIEATVEPGTAGADTVLVDQEGRKYPLRNLMAHLVPISPMTDEFHDYLREHFDSIVEGMSAASFEELSEEDLLRQIRVRLLPAAARVEIPASYAQTVTPDLVAVLCVDSPRTVALVNDSQLEGRDVRSLFDAGFRNVMAEPIEQNQEISPGVHLLAGPSVFIATKVIGIASLIGTVLPDAPDGMIVGVPHRHLLFAHPMAGASSVAAIGQLAKAVAAEANDEAPSGPLSASIFYWKDGVFESVGGADETGKIHIRPSERMMEALNREG